MKRKRRSAVINLSAPHYNLGAAKLATWLRSQGDRVTELVDVPAPMVLASAYELVCFSAIFSWDVLKGIEAAGFSNYYEVWAGGPGFQHMRDRWFELTGVEPVLGLDPRFERQRGAAFRMTYAARGCPLGCSFCGVTKWEGREYSLDYEFEPAPILLDNNLTDEPADFQDHVIRRYQEAGVPLMDANSGFEPRNFTEETCRRWSPILRGPWRCGYDYLPEWRSVKRFMAILAGVRSRQKRIYVLAGNEPFETCLQRAQEVIEWGGEPHVQPLLKKAAMHRKDYELRYDWTPERLAHFARYFNRWTYKYAPIEEYRCRGLQPFRVMSA